MPRKRIWLFLVFVLLSFGGCSTLKGWFTEEGRRLSAAQSLADHGHPHGASALAVEALSVDPHYLEAAQLLRQCFAKGQVEFRATRDHWESSSEPQRWDHLVEILRWQQTLATSLPKLKDQIEPRLALNLDFALEPVDEELQAALSQAAAFHLELARNLLTKERGPRQARKALAEARVAASFDDQVAGLDDFLSEVEEAATQRIVVIPFYSEQAWRLGTPSGPLGSLISQKLLDEKGLPELTEVFPSDRLITVSGGGSARAGLVSQPEALRLAAEAGQNLVLLGQFTKTWYKEPQKSTRIESRERHTAVVTPEHPEGVDKLWRASVTSTTWSTSAGLSASFSIIEVPTARDLVTAVREAKAEDSLVVTTFTGDPEALTSLDLQDVGSSKSLIDSDTLKQRVLDALATQVAAVVRETLR